MANREYVGGLTLSSLGLRLGLTLAQVFAIGRHAFKVPNGSILLQDAAEVLYMPSTAMYNAAMHTRMSSFALRDA